MAVKSGSLKSNKSEKSDGGSKSGDESRQSSGRGVGAMMLANLHGLTRSRPDILSDSVVSAFTAPNKIPRESLGNYLETKLTEGEVVKEFSRRFPPHSPTQLRLVESSQGSHTTEF